MNQTLCRYRTQEKTLQTPLAALLLLGFGGQCAWAVENQFCNTSLFAYLHQSFIE